MFQKRFTLKTIPFKVALQDFDAFVKARGYRQNNHHMLQNCVNEFLFFLEAKQKLKLKDIHADEIRDYFFYIKQRPNFRKPGNLSEAMIKHHLYSLRLFFDFLLDLDVISGSPVYLPKFQFGTGGEREICTEAEIEEIYSNCLTQYERALLGIAYGCGCRRSEIENLDIHDFLPQTSVLVIRNGKNGKSRSIPVTEIVSRDLQLYIENERDKILMASGNWKCKSFFLVRSGQRCKGNQHNRNLKTLIERTQNVELMSKKISLHSLRHSIATHLIDNGAHIEFVQQFLGHSLIDTTHLYSKRKRRHNKVLSQIK